ncbi:MAG: radical SAM protein [Blastocatellia bacterium]|nr:radical SAM protein [Blastocatellia bacterium]
MRITEIYQSIQGESSYAGLPCIFVRTTGCDLRCTWCDSEFSFYGGQSMSIDEIIERVTSYSAKLVELTGGEPLLQKELPVLANRLIDLGYTVMVETGGHRDISLLNHQVIKIVDIKCPDSGESEKVFWSNINSLSNQDQLKFVIASRKDYEWARQTIKERNLEGRFELLFSPAHTTLKPADLAEWILSDGLKVRLQLQLHKYIWSANARGV